MQRTYMRSHVRAHSDPMPAILEEGRFSYDRLLVPCGLFTPCVSLSK